MGLTVQRGGHLGACDCGGPCCSKPLAGLGYVEVPSFAVDTDLLLYGVGFLGLALLLSSGKSAGRKARGRYYEKKKRRKKIDDEISRLKRERREVGYF